MAKKEKVIKNVVPISTVDGHADKEQVDWLLKHADPSMNFEKVGTFVEPDGSKNSVFKIVGLGAKKLSAKFAKEFGWGKHDGALELVVGEKNSAKDR